MLWFFIRIKRYHFKYAFLTKIMLNNLKNYQSSAQHREQLNSLSSWFDICLAKYVVKM